MKNTKIFLSLICAFMMVVFSSNAFAAKKNSTAGVKEGKAVQQVVSKKIDINSASKNQLEQLPGIGPKIAERISTYRKDNGPFKTIDDLLKVKGIGPKMLEKMRPLISLS